MHYYVKTSVQAIVGLRLMYVNLVDGTHDTAYIGAVNPNLYEQYYTLFEGPLISIAYQVNPDGALARLKFITCR